jgi:tubulin--tyrosine ligase
LRADRPVPLFPGSSARRSGYVRSPYLVVAEMGADGGRSGPNYGRNTTAIFALSSGTIGGAMEAAICGKRAISLSYAFFNRNHDPKIIGAASELSVRLIEHLWENWASDVDLYSVNVPLVEGVEGNKIVYTEMLQNRWGSGSCFEGVEVEDGDVGDSSEEAERAERKIREGKEVENNREKENGKRMGGNARFTHVEFKWAPRFADVFESVLRAGPGKYSIYFFVMMF